MIMDVFQMYCQIPGGICYSVLYEVDHTLMLSLLGQSLPMLMYYK